ncbi:MAG TPA: SRPBCC family protein [Acidimicrobiales bacterium]|nr:SRPBCC family protein [Acidimicrobiales bacterium]
MPSVSDSIQIQRPVEEVFSALADPQVQMRYDAEMMRANEQLTAGPIAKGTRFRGKFKGMGSVEYTYEEFEPNRLIQHHVKMPFGRMHHRFELGADGDGTRLNQSIKIEPNALGSILWPIMMKRMMQKRVETLDGLVKRFVETSE